MVTRYSSARKVKEVLSHYVERELLSVRTGKGRAPQITVKHRIGARQAYMTREELATAGFSLLFSGYENEFDTYGPTGVKITIS